MDILKDDIKNLFGHYLIASVGSALVVSVYSFVDTIAVGQSVGPMGAAAIAAINPIFALMVFLFLQGAQRENPHFRPPLKNISFIRIKNIFF